MAHADNSWGGLSAARRVSYSREAARWGHRALPIAQSNFRRAAGIFATRCHQNRVRSLVPLPGQPLLDTLAGKV